MAARSRMCSTAARDLGGVHVHAGAAVPAQRRPGGRSVPHRPARRHGRSAAAPRPGGCSCRRSSTTPTPATPSTSSSTVGTAGTVRTLGLGRRAAAQAPARPARSPGRWCSSTAPTPRCSTPSTCRRADDVQHRHAGADPLERRARAATSPTSPASSRSRHDRRRAVERRGGPVQFMQQHIALDYVMRVEPARRPLRRASSREGRDHRPPVPVVRRWSTCRRGRSARCASVATGEDRRGRGRRPRARSPRSRSSRRSSTTGRRSGRTTRWPASCSTAPTARSASSASSTSRSTRSARACGSRRCGPPEERARRRAGDAHGLRLRQRHHGLEAHRRARRRPASRLRGARRCDAGRRHRLVRAGAASATAGRETETQMLFPVDRRGHRALGHAPRTRSASPARAAPTTSPAQSFAFVGNLEATGAWPPISESHVEMDGAWALYEAWVRLQHGDVDAALVFGVGHLVARRPARGAVPAERPVLPDAAVGRPRVAGRAAGAGACSTPTGDARRDLAEIAARSRRSALANPFAQVRATSPPRTCSPSRTSSPPLRAERLPAGLRRRRRGGARRRRPRPRACASARRGSAASTTASSRTTRACATSRVSDVDPAGRRGTPAWATRRSRWPSCRRTFSHEELDPPRRARPRRRRRGQPVGRRARRQPGDGHRASSASARRSARSTSRARDRTLGHATSGPCLQQNLVCVLEGELMAERCAVVGIGQTHHTKVRDDVSLAGLLREAALRALDDAEMTWRDIDAVVIGTAPDTFEGVMMPELYLADALGRGGQADHARAHRRQRRRLDRDRGRRTSSQSGVRKRVLTVAFEKQSEGDTTWAPRRRAQRRRRRRRLLRPAHPRLHRALEGARVRRLDGGGEGPQERAEEPVRAPEDPRHQPRDGARVPDGVGAGAPPRVLPGVRRRLRDGAHRRGRRRRGVEAAGLGARHRDAQRARPVPGPRPGEPAGRARTARPTSTARPASPNPLEDVDVVECYVPFSWYEPMWMENLGFAALGEGWKLTEERRDRDRRRPAGQLLGRRARRRTRSARPGCCASPRPRCRCGAWPASTRSTAPAPRSATPTAAPRSTSPCGSCGTTKP